MSHETSKSPSSCDREVKIQMSSVDEPLVSYSAPDENRHLSFSVPLTATVIPIDDCGDEKSAERDERKKARKSIDESNKSRRKDTATSFTNFLHRFTRFDRDEKHKSPVCEVEEDHLLERPDQLTLPEPGVDNWLELKTLATDHFRTALDMGNEAGQPMFEWKPDSLEEYLLTEYTPMDHRDLISMEREDPSLDVMEQSLANMLDDFRSGNMRSFSAEQLAAMQAAKQEHEGVTNLHLSLYQGEMGGSEELSSSQADSLYEQLSHKLYHMHSRLGNIAAIPTEAHASS